MRRGRRGEPVGSALGGVVLDGVGADGSLQSRRPRVASRRSRTGRPVADSASRDQPPVMWDSPIRAWLSGWSTPRRRVVSASMNRHLPLAVVLCVVSHVTAQQSLWVGTTDGVIRVFELTAQGRLQLRSKTVGPRGLGFLAFHPLLPVVYAAVGKSVQMYRIENRIPKTAAKRTSDVGGTHIEVDRAGRFVFLASYGGGAVLAFPLDERFKKRLRIGVPIEAQCAPLTLELASFSLGLGDRARPSGASGGAECCETLRQIDKGRIVDVGVVGGELCL